MLLFVITIINAAVTYMMHLVPVEAVYLADSKGGEEGKKDTTFLARALPILDAEYDFWMSSKNGRLVSVPVPGTRESVRLNRYFSKDNTPRPESYREDIDTIGKKGGGGGGGKTIAREIRAAAESGWDFSSRWMMQEGRVLLLLLLHYYCYCYHLI
mmetsp:Transcript_32467/g.55148  ORF Transcript_32467/g.55148 Transcript_32467/m.55148 type:complete len:156 (+) Transcript_32467:108-575(+)